MFPGSIFIRQVLPFDQVTSVFPFVSTAKKFTALWKTEIVLVIWWKWRPLFFIYSWKWYCALYSKISKFVPSTWTYLNKLVILKIKIDIKKAIQWETSAALFWGNKFMNRNGDLWIPTRHWKPDVLEAILAWFHIYKIFPPVCMGRLLWHL